jgi:hypothetical protein
MLTLLCIVSCTPDSQTPPAKSSTAIHIPFELQRNKIILPVTVGDSRVLKVILDTGMSFEGLLIYEDEGISLENGIEVLVPGAGADEPSTALMAESALFHIGDVECTNQRIIVLKSETMKGFPSDGVTGYSLFGNYIVEVDYDRSLIVLHQEEKVNVDTSWHTLALTFKDNRIPWIEATINTTGEQEVPVSLYIDLASSEALELLVREHMAFELPDNLEDSYLGRGLSGDIYGQTGKITSLKLASFELTDVLTAFAPAEVRSKQEGADGILGNNALRRFNCIYDYENLKLYIKPNFFYSEPF